ncbi:MAG: hypothetical protein DRI77_03610 [Chloroflexi bacterium]|nr:MAG: hypothetical protein DRI77_03610 [Chloroflexota bacterium]
MIRGSTSAGAGASVGSGSSAGSSAGASVGSGGASVGSAVGLGAHDATSPKTRVSAIKMLRTRKVFIFFSS